MKIMLLFMAFVIFAFGMGVFLHEQVHVMIFNQYGIDSQVYYFKYFPDVATVPEKNCPNDSCILAQSINEAIDYNTTPIFMILAVGLMIIIAELEFRRENETPGKK